MSWQLEHNKYLNSSTWSKKREEAFAYHGKKCASCGSTKLLCIHHVSYITYNDKGKGKELMQELIPLCRRHHDLVHELIREFLADRKNDYKYNWDKASQEAIDYLVSPKRRKAKAERVKKVYYNSNKKNRKRNKKKQKKLAKLRRGIERARSRSDSDEGYPYIGGYESIY
jgi:hypothetical protein